MVNKQKYQRIELSKLFLDTENPRLPKSLYNSSETEIINYLLMQAATLELMQAIGENDFFEGEQLLVVKVDDKYKVIEGNRRLASLKLLQDYRIATVKTKTAKLIFDEAKFRPTEIPCLIFENEDDIRKYLGFRHITGIKSWGLSEKARFLSQLKTKHFSEEIPFNEICRGLAKIIGSRKDYVKRLLLAYEIYKTIEDENFYYIRDLNDTTFFVGYISDSLSRSKISEFLGVNMSIENPLEKLNLKNLKEWTHWFYEKNDQNKTRLKGKSSDLNDLNKVIGNELAFSAFNKGASLSEAVELTEDIHEIFRHAIKKSYENIELSDRMVHKVKEFYPEIDDDLNEIRRIALKIKRAKEDFEDEI